MDSNHSLADEIYSLAVVSERLSVPNLYLLIESNYLPLHVKQIRFRYAKEALKTKSHRTHLMFLLDTYSLLTMVHTVAIREPNLIFICTPGEFRNLDPSVKSGMLCL